MASLDWRGVERELNKQGWRVERTTQNHYRCFPPDKSKPLIHIALGSANWRALRNSLAELRRSGFVWGGEEAVESQRVEEVESQRAEEGVVHRQTEVSRTQLVVGSDIAVSSQTSAEFPAALWRAREAAGLKRAELGERLGVAESAVWAWETDKATPIVDHYLALLDIFPALPEPAEPPRDIAKPMGRLGLVYDVSRPVNETDRESALEPVSVSEEVSMPVVSTPSSSPSNPSKASAQEVALASSATERKLLVRLIRIVVALRARDAADDCLNLLVVAKDAGLQLDDLIELLQDEEGGARARRTTCPIGIALFSTPLASRARRCWRLDDRSRSWTWWRTVTPTPRSDVS